MSDTRLSAVLLIGGAVVFWLGAFYWPMWRAWGAPDAARHLAVVGARRIEWLVVNVLMGVGVVVTMLGVAVLARVLDNASAEIARTAWTASGAVWIGLTALRLGVTTACGAEFAGSGAVPLPFDLARAWEGVAFTWYMQVAYVATGIVALAAVPLVPGAGLGAALFSFAGAALYPFVLSFQPPLMIHVAPLVLGVALWLA